MTSLPRAKASKQARRNRFQVARALYGTAFEPQTRAKIGESMADWSELAQPEREFTLAHLLYLNLQAQATTQRMLNAIRETLEDADDALQALADELTSDEEDDEHSDGEESEPETNQEGVFDGQLPASNGDEIQHLRETGTEGLTGADASEEPPNADGNQEDVAVPEDEELGTGGENVVRLRTDDTPHSVEVEDEDDVG